MSFIDNMVLVIMWVSLGLYLNSEDNPHLYQVAFWVVAYLHIFTGFMRMLGIVIQKIVKAARRKGKPPAVRYSRWGAWLPVSKESKNPFPKPSDGSTKDPMHRGE